MSGYPPGMVSGRVSKTITVDLQNLIVTATTPANPEAIPWDPEANTPYTCAATASLCYKVNLPVTLSIYDTEQNLVKTFTQWQPVGIGTTPLSYVWDGSTNWGPPGSKAIKGVYLFRWEVGGPPSMPDYDCDKSAFATVTTPGTLVDRDPVDDSTSQWTCLYTLASTSQRPASEGHIDAYNVDLTPWHTHELLPTDLTAASHSVSYQTQDPQLAVPVWLISARDGHADLDKGHRRRWALQHNDK